jgi:hypothetical protein
MLSAPALAGSDDGFSALQGVDAEVLSVNEMRATTAQVNAFDIAAALFAQAGTLKRFPRELASTTRLAQYYQSNAAQINATFAKLGILTACKVCK